jgi:hypothetical protein
MMALTKPVSLSSVGGPPKDGQNRGHRVATVTW